MRNFFKLLSACLLILLLFKTAAEPLKEQSFIAHSVTPKPIINATAAKRSYLQQENLRNRYIVVLKEKAYIAYQHEYYQSLLVERSITDIDDAVIKERGGSHNDLYALKSFKRNPEFKKHLKAHKKSIRAQQNTLVKWLDKHQVKVISQHELISNAIVIEAANNQISTIKSAPYIKSITPEQVVSANLDESVAILHAPQVWSQQNTFNQDITGNNINVAIIDTGIDYTHPALGGCFGASCRVKGGYDFFNNDADPKDDSGHGTHIAGIIGANSSSIKGVAPDVNFYAYKVLSAAGVGYTADILSALDAAMDLDGNSDTDDPADIINLSFTASAQVNDPIVAAVEVAINAGIIVVVSAGNGGEYGDITNISPANSQKVITVGAIDKYDVLYSNSSKGELLNNNSLKPEIVSPGVDILSTHLGGGFAYLSGTSMAAPHISGASALLKQANPSLSPLEIKAQLMAGAINLDYNPLQQGSGRVNVFKSLYADIISPSGNLNFGVIPINLPYFQTTRILQLQNLDNETKAITLSIPNNLPSQVRLRFDTLAYNETMELTLEKNSTEAINVTLQIDNIYNHPFSDNDADIFYGNISVQATDNDFIVAFAYKMADGFEGDFDNDGISNNADPDIDGDNYHNIDDVFPFDKTEWLDLDNDGMGDNSDLDIDGDGYVNNNDIFPFDVTEWLDTDNDGIGNNTDSDIDGDGVLNDEDNFPLDDSRSLASERNDTNSGSSGGGGINLWLVIMLMFCYLKKQEHK